MWFFVLLSVIGLLASAAVHFSTYAGVDLSELLPGVWLLHIGIFVVCIPAIATQNALLRTKGKRSRNWNETLANAPRWMRGLCAVLAAYAFLNFAAFIYLMHEGGPHHEANGTFVLSNHGRISRTLTEAEYHRYRAYEVRGFSGHWMIFYALAMTMIVAGMNTPAPADAQAAITTSATNAPTSACWWLLPIWAHASLQIVAQMIGFLAAALLMFFATLPVWKSGLWCFLFPVMFITAVVSSIGAAGLVKRYLPVRCPVCGRRAEYQATPSPGHYICADCGHVQDALKS